MRNRHLRTRLAAFLSLSILLLAYNNCTGGMSAGSGADSSLNSSGSEGTLVLDGDFGTNGCIAPDFSGFGSGNSQLYKMTDGFLMSYPGVTSKHTATGELDISWGNQGYLRNPEFNAALGSPYDNSYSLLGVDSMDRIYFYTANLICRFSKDLVLDTSWGGDTGFPAGCAMGEEAPIVEDGNGQIWQIYTLQSLLLAHRYSSTGVLLDNGYNFGSKSFMTSGFSFAPPVAVGSNIYLSYVSVDQQLVRHANILSINIADKSQSEVATSLLPPAHGVVGLGRTSATALFVGSKGETGSSGALRAVTPDLSGFIPFNNGLVQTVSTVSGSPRFAEAGDQNGLLAAWGPLLRYGEDGSLVGRHTPASGRYVSTLGLGQTAFAVLISGNSPPKLCRFTLAP